MVTTHNPGNPNIRKLLIKNWNILEYSDELKNLFSTHPIIGQRRLPNLRDILTSNKIRYPAQITLPQQVGTELPPVCHRLGKCTYCPLLHKITSFKSTHTGKTHKCRNLPPPHRLTCEIYNIIYLIHCRHCNSQYIGESSRGLRNRIYEHISSAKLKHKQGTTPVSRHFSEKGHSHKDMKFSVIEWLGNKNGPEMTAKRRNRELQLIWNIPTVSPIGVNQFV